MCTQKVLFVCKLSAECGIGKCVFQRLRFEHIVKRVVQHWSAQGPREQEVLAAKLIHFVTDSLCHWFTISLFHFVTISLCHYFTIFLIHYFSVSLFHYVIMSLSRIRYHVNTMLTNISIFSSSYLILILFPHSSHSSRLVVSGSCSSWRQSY